MATLIKTRKSLNLLFFGLWKTIRRNVQRFTASESIAKQSHFNNLFSPYMVRTKMWNLTGGLKVDWRKRVPGTVLQANIDISRRVKNTMNEFSTGDLLLFKSDLSLVNRRPLPEAFHELLVRRISKAWSKQLLEMVRRNPIRRISRECFVLSREFF